ncbi:MAG: beta-propeller fold lactonase family protein [Terriglobales bacterium]
MLKRTGGVLTLVGMCALSLFLLNCGSSSSRPSGLLYVISQENFNISAFSIDLDNGGLSLINSNAHTCLTLTGSNPVSCGLPRNILLDPTKNVAFLLNQGLSPVGSTTPVAPTIYSYTVNSDGSLSSPTAAATLPLGDLSLAMTENTAGNLLFVIDQGSSLTPLDCPNPGGSYGSDCPSILVFNANPGSTTLTPASVYPLSRMPTALSVLTFTPPNNGTTQTLLFLTSNKDLTQADNDNELSVYSVDSSGNLSEQANSPYTTAPNPGVVQAVNTNAPPQTTGGVYVYAGSQGTAAGTIEAFAVCTIVGTQGNGGNNCSQSEVDSSQLLSIGAPAGAGKTPIAMLVDPTNNFLYVAANGSSQVFAFLISTGTGTLSPLPPVTSEPTGAQPVGLAMHANYNNSGQFLYSSNNGGQTITGFSMNATTGSLSTNPSTTLFLQGAPYGIVAK